MFVICKFFFGKSHRYKLLQSLAQEVLLEVLGSVGDVHKEI